MTNDDGALSDQAAGIALRRLVPLLLACYVINWIDRVNVGFAALQMNEDLGFDAAVYGFGAGIFFVGYALFEIPSNMILYRVGARRWIARIMVTWGLLASATMFVRSAASFNVLRFALGVAEAGFLPGVLFYLGSWFPNERRAGAIAAFMAASPVASIIGGPLAGALLLLDSNLGLAGWQWLFLLEGLPAVVLGLIVLRYLPDVPADARWLTADQKLALDARLRAEQAAASGMESSLGRSLRHPRVWHLGAIYFLGAIGTYGLSLWLPAIIKAASGYSDLGVGFVTAIPYVAATAGMVLIGRLSDRAMERRWHAAGACLLAAAGFLGSALSGTPLVALAFLSVAAFGNYGRNGPFWAMPREFLSGPAAAGGFALINTVGALGGFVGPYLVGLVRDATGEFSGGLLVLAAGLLGAGLLTLRLPRSQFGNMLRP